MRDSVLIQRLKRPLFNKDGSPSPFHAFGAGLPNGGIPQEVMNEISKIFRFDYMGNASFEWGRVWDSLHLIMENPGSYVSAFCSVHFRYKNFFGMGHQNGGNLIEGNSKIYYICPKDIEKEIHKRIESMAEEKERVLVEPTLLSLSLAVPHNSVDEIIGWLELDNNFLFFTSEGIWENMCDFFKIER